MHRVDARRRVQAEAIDIDELVGVLPPEAPQVVVAGLLGEIAVEILVRRGIQRGAPALEDHLVFPLYGAIESRGRFQEVELDLDSAFGVDLLDDGQVRLHELAAVGQGEARAPVGGIDEDAVGSPRRETRPLHVLLRLLRAEFVGLQGGIRVPGALEGRDFPHVGVVHQARVELLEGEQVLHGLAHILVGEERRREVHVQAVNAVGSLQVFLLGMHPPLRDGVEPQLGRPHLGEDHRHEVDLALLEVVEHVGARHDLEHDPIDVVQAAEVELVAAPPVLEAREDDPFPRHRLGDDVGPRNDLPAEVRLLDPLGAELLDVARHRPEHPEVIQRPPALRGAHDLEGQGIDGLHRGEIRLGVVVVIRIEDLPAAHHLVAEDVVGRRDLRPVAETRIRVQLEVHGFPVGRHPPVRRHPGYVRVGHGVAPDEGEHHAVGAVPGREAVVGIRAEQPEGEGVGGDEVVEGAALEGGGVSDARLTQVGRPDDIRGDAAGAEHRGRQDRQNQDT